MQINNGTDSIIDEIDSLCDSDVTSYPLADKIRRVNIGLDEVITEILQADGTWQYDDTNHTDLPIGTTDLVEGQQDYSFEDEFLVIERVEVKDVNGNWHKLKPFDQSTEKGAMEELFKTDGLPEYYDKQARSILLYPQPTATQTTLTNGLKVWFKRNADKFTTSDTTQEPGFASLFHNILSYMASIPYCMTYKKDRVRNYQNEVFRLKQEIRRFYSRREKDVKKRLVANEENSR
jgi:hypothetical protein